MKNSLIEWTHHTLNLWWGCTKVSEACRFCYAAMIAMRFGPGPDRKPVKWGAGQPRVERLERAREEAVALNASAKKRGVRERVFVNSMSDWLDAEVPEAWLTYLVETIYLCPALDFQLLTKRPENFNDRLFLAECHAGAEQKNATLANWIDDWRSGRPPVNVWVGTTVEDQACADTRVPALLKIPARVRFLSCEPLLGPVDLLLDGECSSWACRECGSRNVDTGVTVGEGDVGTYKCHSCNYVGGGEDAAWKSDIHWVICGGESGPGARPMHPDWARSLRDQCAAAGVAFFFKQWGEWYPGCSDGKEFLLDNRHGVEDFDGAITVHAFPVETDGTFQEMGRIGKKAAGRILDGVEHNAFPEVRS